MRRSVRDDDGSTLIELLVAVSIIGYGVATIVGGLFSTVVASDVNREQANIATYLTSYAEAVKGDAYQTACPVAYTGSSFTLPAGFTKSAVTEYWNGTSFIPTCGADTGLQRVTVTIGSVDGRTSMDVQIAKRKP